MRTVIFPDTITSAVDHEDCDYPIEIGLHEGGHCVSIRLPAKKLLQLIEEAQGAQLRSALGPVTP